MPHEGPFQGKFCTSPFEYCFVDGGGECYLCCPGAVPVSIGSLAVSPWETVWNSLVAQKVRASIHEGSFHFCKAEHCPYYEIGVRLTAPEAVEDPYYLPVIQNQTVAMARGPREVVLAYDPTCNLSCPFCRVQHVSASGAAFTAAERIHQHVWTDALRDCTKLTIAGDGDPFASRLYRQALQNYDPARYPNMRIHLVTNGLMMTPAMWDSIAAAHPAIYWINVSVNAATPETFAINQRGGSLATLLPNLEHIASVRRQSRHLEFLTISFIVQANNYREMPAFVALGRSLGVDRINFVHLMSGPMSPAEYAQHAVHRPSHPEHAHFLDIIQDPQFRAADVALSNLAQFLPNTMPRKANVLTSIDAVDDDTQGHTEALTNWEKFAYHLDLGPAQEQRVKKLVDNKKAEVARIFRTPTADGGESPVARFLTLLNAGTLERDAALQAFEMYPAKTIYPGTSQSHAKALVRLAFSAGAELMELLTPEQRQAYAALDISMVHAIPTDYDPLAEAIAQEARGRALST